MPILSIQIPQKQFEMAKIRARREGFKNPTEWVRILVSRQIALEESPKMRPSQIVEMMRKTGLYNPSFLKGLKDSLDYADKTA